jgi:hypothetical protein
MEMAMKRVEEVNPAIAIVIDFSSKKIRRDVDYRREVLQNDVQQTMSPCGRGIANQPG